MADRDSAAVVAWAQDLAGTHLAGMPRRWQHTKAVASKARSIATAALTSAGDQEALVAAAWLHDVGYGPEVAETGFHPLDGARLVEAAGRPRVAALVAHHSGAASEAELRGLAGELADFPNEQSAVTDALTYCDLTTGPDGQDMTVDERLDDIEARYGPDHVVTRAVRAAEPALRAAVARTAQRLEVQA